MRFGNFGLVLLQECRDLVRELVLDNRYQHRAAWRQGFRHRPQVIILETGVIEASEESVAGALLQRRTAERFAGEQETGETTDQQPSAKSLPASLLLSLGE